MKRVVITGATGVVGMALIRKCIESGTEAVVLVNPDSKRVGRIPDDPLVKVIRCGLDDYASVTPDSLGIEPLSGSNYVDAMFHLAWGGTFGDARNDKALQDKNAVSDVDPNEILKFHRSHGKLATVTAIAIDQRFGVLEMAGDDTITSFREKQKIDSSRISGGFMVLEPEVFDYITDGDRTVFEKGPMMKLAAEGNLMGYKYDGFWQCMDTKREMDRLEEMWDLGNAPWKVW